jgi:MFS family permease
MSSYSPQVDEDDGSSTSPALSVAVVSKILSARFSPSAKIFYGWVVLFMACLIQSASYPGTTTGFGAVLDIMITDVGTSLTEMGTIYSIASFVGGVLSPVTGFCVDRYGGRLTIAILTVIFSLSFLFLSYSSDRYAVCIGFMVIRFSGIGGMAVSSASVVAKWFEKYRGRAMGVLTVVSSLLNSGTSVAFRQSVQTWGWRSVFQGIAAIGCCILFPLFALFVRSCPEDIGVLPDGRAADQSISTAASNSLELKQLSDVYVSTGESHDDVAVLYKVNFTLTEAARTAVFWVLISGSFLNATIAGGVFFHVSTFLSDNGLPGSSVQDVFLPYGISQAISAVAFGWALDRYPMKFSLALGYVIQALALLALYLATSRPLAILTGCLLGVNGGCLMTCFRTVRALLCRFQLLTLLHIYRCLQLASAGSTSVLFPASTAACRSWARASVLSALRWYAMPLGQVLFDRSSLPLSSLVFLLNLKCQRFLPVTCMRILF